MGRGRSKAGGGGIGALQRLAANETNPNRVLNSVDDSKMGTTFNTLSPANKAAIRGLLSLRRQDIEHLLDRDTNTLSQSVRIGKDRYTVIISTEDSEVVYSLKKGNKNLVKNGSYTNVANQLSLLLR